MGPRPRSHRYMRAVKLKSDATLRSVISGISQEMIQISDLVQVPETGPEYEHNVMGLAALSLYGLKGFEKLMVGIGTCHKVGKAF